MHTHTHTQNAVQNSFKRLHHSFHYCQIIMFYSHIKCKVFMAFITRCQCYFHVSVHIKKHHNKNELFATFDVFFFFLFFFLIPNAKRFFINMQKIKKYFI